MSRGERKIQNTRKAHEMKNTSENITKSINDYTATYREDKNGKTFKYEYSYSGTSVLDARPVFAEYVTIFSIERGVIKNHEYTGRHYTADGRAYPKNAFIR